MTYDDISRIFALLAELQELDPQVAARVLHNIVQTLQGERPSVPVHHTEKAIHHEVL